MKHATCYTQYQCLWNCLRQSAKLLETWMSIKQARARLLYYEHARQSNSQKTRQDTPIRQKQTSYMNVLYANTFRTVIFICQSCKASSFLHKLLWKIANQVDPTKIGGTILDLCSPKWSTWCPSTGQILQSYLGGCLRSVSSAGAMTSTENFDSLRKHLLDREILDDIWWLGTRNRCLLACSFPCGTHSPSAGLAPHGPHE